MRNFLCFSTAVQDLFPENESAAHRDKSREWGRLKAKLEPLFTLGDSGSLVFGRSLTPTEHHDSNRCVLNVLLVALVVQLHE